MQSTSPMTNVPRVETLGQLVGQFAHDLNNQLAIALAQQRQIVRKRMLELRGAREPADRVRAHAKSNLLEAGAQGRGVAGSVTHAAAAAPATMG